MFNPKKNIKITDKNGDEINYHILCTFNSNKNHKSYIIFTDFSRDSNHAIHVYYACYETSNHSLLKPVETPEEIAFLDNILSSLEQELNIKFIKPTISS